jgi:hypothetical protein
MSPRKPPVCLFCGSSGPLTREHILRADFRKHFGSDRFESRNWGWQLNQAGDRIEVDRKYWALPFERTVKEVCASCNNGWMNDLENEAKDILLDLAEGRERTLNRAQLRIVTRWVAKTAAVIEAAENTLRAMQPGQYQALRAGNAPPRFALWLYPLEPNGRAKWRSTPAGLAEGPTGPKRLTSVHCHTSIQLRRVHFFSIHGDNSGFEMIRIMNMARVLGKSVSTDSSSLEWRLEPVAPVDAADVRHAAAVEYERRRLAEVGVQPIGQLEVF